MISCWVHPVSQQRDVTYGMTAMSKRDALMMTQRKDLHAKEKIGKFIWIFQSPGGKITRFVIWTKI